MKEYKTLRVTPEEETDVITAYARFGWTLEDSREVYNESQEIVGVNEKVTSYGSFMRGFTGNDGKVETQVQTQTHVTHYITLRFAREAAMKGYERLVQLEAEFTNSQQPQYAPLKPHVKNKPPIAVTSVAAVAIVIIIISLLQIVAGVKPETWELIVCAVVGVAAVLAIILSWVLYKKNYSAKERKNQAIARENEEIKAQNAKLEEEYNAKMNNLIAEANDIIRENVQPAQTVADGTISKANS